jgi:hypothetical protein
MFCRPIVRLLRVCLLNCITETLQITEGRKYFPPGPHVGQPSLIQGCLSFLGVKWLGDGVRQSPPSSDEVKERVELYLYSPSGLSWPVLGLT